MPVRLSDLSPQARKQALDQLGVRKAVRTPAPFTEPPPPTERQHEIQAIRRALSLVAAQLGEGRVEWAVGRLVVELARLEVLRVTTSPQATGSPQKAQQVLP